MTVSVSRHSKANHKPSICFVALNAYNLLSHHENINHIGGAEVQQVRIASWLTHRGYSVSFVTLDHGQPDGINIDGIRVFKAYARDNGIRGIRFFYPRWSSLWAAMARADTDLYYQRNAGCETGQVALWCYLHHRKFIFATAALSNCDPKVLARKRWMERSLYRIGVRFADAIIAQTTTQQEMYQRNMGLSTTLIRSCGWDMNKDFSCKPPSALNHRPLHVLWVGRISKEKRFEWLLDVAESCPEIVFDVVGATNTDSNYASSLTKRAEGISNVKMYGWVPYSEMTKFYQRCQILCCTSVREGFPNTFLEAWPMGIPIISTFDPDDVIVSNELGWIANDVNEIVTCLKEISQSQERWLKASKAAKRYYQTNHTPEVCLPILENLLLKLVIGC